MTARSFGSLLALAAGLVWIGGCASQQATAPARAAWIPREKGLYRSQVHRGGGGQYPDNALETFLWCWGRGCTPEADARLTKDGVAIAMHDDKLGRIASNLDPKLAELSASEMDWADMRDVDIGSKWGAQYSTYRLATMESVFAAMKGHPERLLYLDEKGAPPKMMAEMAARFGVAEQTYYTSPDWRKVVEWRKHAPTGRSMVWLGCWPENNSTGEIARAEAFLDKKLGEMEAFGFEGIDVVQIHLRAAYSKPDPFCPSSAYVRKAIERLHRYGVSVNGVTWTCGDNPDVYHAMWELGFDHFTSDYPDAMFAAIGELKGDAGGAAKPADGRGYAWTDARTLPVEGKAFKDTKGPFDRLPASAQGRVTQGVWWLQHDTAGELIRFRTGSQKLALSWDLVEDMLDMDNMSRGGKSGFDVYRRKPGGKWIFCRSLVPTARTGNFREFDWNPEDECMINFPLYNGVTRLEVGTTPGARIEPIDVKKKPIVWYGVSTTQGCAASRPGMAFPAIISRRLDIPHVNLGFSGCGRMEMEMVDYVAALDAQVYVIDTPGNLNLKTMEERYEKFIRELHRRRPATPIVIAEQRVYSSGVELPRPMGKYLAAMRDRLLAEGGWTIGYVATADMFHYEVDETTMDSPAGHPNDFGMMQLADAYQKAIEAVLPR